MTLHKFYFDTIVLARTNGWRYGQAMFNHLLSIRPDLAEQIRGTEIDPFYKVSPVDMDGFFEFVESNWK